MLRLTRILLHGANSADASGGSSPKHIGWLSSFGEINRVQFTQEHIENAQRPVLSQVYVGQSDVETKAIMQARFDERVVKSIVLPSYFENLLPEGLNRDSLAAKRPHRAS